MDSDTEPEFDPSLLELDASLLQASTPQKRVPLVERVCEYLAQQNSDTKSFLLAYLHSTNEKIIRRKKQWALVAKGWKSTEAVLDAIAELVNQKPECRPKWNDWVLKKAKLIVAQQSPPQGSQYININMLDTSFFDHKQDVKREADIVQSMDFLHQLITSKLQHGHQAWKSERKRRTEHEAAADLDSDGSDSEFDSGLESDSPEQSEFGKAKESSSAYVYRRSKDAVENANTRMKAVSAILCLDLLGYAPYRTVLLCHIMLDCFNNHSDDILRMQPSKQWTSGSKHNHFACMWCI
ncbi:uncharacterized protein MELLADRAFT_88898 [Melampsora larici-populina 98AG31]|uniref:Uncharacterized protein n=1 Tax=Melampsora larici-populina (strain 98AG31 / pathotype 3-4-7) TaxID=747676 RepID=F4R671_MELLP|nr:uncharacterized protein MELLADRAFT_88898 [Melampsora larici-populina 98AG31]EGG11833.1 hypothetical protein MELLADRAFT_88898 [Melampsora larici-populina 98AG31]